MRLSAINGTLGIVPRFGAKRPIGTPPQAPALDTLAGLTAALRRNPSQVSLTDTIQGINSGVKTKADARQLLLAMQQGLNRLPTYQGQKGYHSGGFVYDYNFSVLNRVGYAMTIILSAEGTPPLARGKKALLLGALNDLGQEVAQDYTARVARAFGGPYSKKHLVNAVHYIE